MWTWFGNSPSGLIWSYHDRVLVRKADSDLITCPTFNWLGLTDHKPVWVSVRLVNRPCLSSDWKFNTSLLEIWDFWMWLENLMQRAIVGVVIGTFGYGTFGCGWKT